ncbi:tyrosine-type recombinase/integrase [Dysgonomonas mossii]|uniref:tyrosine-type recombinase/integrase n=1 Tax=Dysgonomonas mossii TaxID=163665 RepID=UPI0039931CD1
MAITFNYELNSNPTRSKTYVIFLRITEDKKHKRVKTTIELKRENDFNPKGKKNNNWVKPVEPNSKKWNEELDLFLERAKDIYRELSKKGTATKENIAETLETGERSEFFLEYADTYIKRVYDVDFSTYQKYVGFMNKLKGFLNDKDLMFSEIDLSLLNKFKTHLQKLPNSRNKKIGLNPNYISKLFDQFQSLYNKGIAELKIEIGNHPFKGLELKRVETNVEKLTAEEITSIFNLDLEKDSKLWHSRNYFLLAFYLGGIRISNLLKLRGTNIDGGRINFSAVKGEKKLSTILLPEAIAILASYIDLDNLTNKYILPELDNNASYAVTEDTLMLSGVAKELLKKTISSKTVLINKNLNKLAKIAGVNKRVTTKISRHSFSDFARKTGIDVYTISKILGHSDIQMTQNYLSKFDLDSQDEAMNKISKALQKNDSSLKTLKESLMKLTLEERNSLFKEIQSTNYEETIS